jgi:hypothetical protein
MGISRIKTSHKGFLSEYPQWYIESRRAVILGTREKRYTYRHILNEHLNNKYGYSLLSKEELSHVNKVVFLLSSSRGGSSVTIDILKQQAKGSEGSGKKIFCLPGESRPYFELSELTSPFKDCLSDRLDSRHTRDSVKTSALLTELSSEVGYPESRTRDLLGFAITVYGRLSLQWPNINFGSAGNAISKIHEAIKKVSSTLEGNSTYTDSDTSRENLMYAIKELFSEIDLRFYDNLNNKNAFVEFSHIPSYDYFIEEPPFIVPSPWHFVRRSELSQGILLMKDASDPWRIPFWQEILKKHSISWIHLTRNAPESINGLCDGWKFPYGYLGTRSPMQLKVRGYTNSTQPWTEWYTKYSTSDHIWELLLSGKTIDLEYIAAIQWADAHRAIIDLVGNEPSYYKLASDQDPSKFGFEWLRSEPVEAVTKICNKLDLELTPSLINAAESIEERRVQVTPGTDAKSDRWRAVKNYNLIRAYVQEQNIIEVSQELGYFLK